MILKSLLFSFLVLTSIQSASAANIGMSLIQQRHHVVCGIDREYKTLAYQKDGVWRGFDADICRAVAAAVIGDAESFKLLPVAKDNIGGALNSGKIDIMLGHQTLSAHDEASQNIIPVDTLYYDKLIFASRKQTDAQSMKDFAGAKVCVLRESNDLSLLKLYLEKHALPLKTLELPALSAMKEAFYLKRCDLIAGNETFIKGIIADLKSEDTPEILPEQIGLLTSKAYSSASSPRLNTAFRWIINALKLAAAEDITLQNIDTFKASKNESVRNLLGLDPYLWKKMNLSTSWAEEYIKTYGNYQQLIERSFETETASETAEPSFNNVTTKGGLIDFTPFI